MSIFRRRLMMAAVGNRGVPITITDMFTKRTTANGLQVLNNKALLKGVRGNSMQFWQKLQNCDFSDGQTPWKGRTGYNFTISVSDGILSIKGPSNCQPYLIQESIFTETHTYLLVARVRIVEGPAGSILYLRNANNTWSTGVRPVLNTWYTVSTVQKISNNTSGGNQWFGIMYNEYGATMEVDWALCIDLTRLRGTDASINNYDSFRKYFPLNVYDRVNIYINNSMTYYISKDGEDATLQTVPLNLTTLTGKLNGEGESVVIFPDGMKSSCNEVVNDTYDEIKQVDGVWKAFKRIGTARATSAISGRGEYEILAEEEVYVLDDQTIPTELTVADQGTEEILPVNGATPTTAPAIMEIEYKVAPTLTSLSLGNTVGGRLSSDLQSTLSPDTITDIDNIIEEIQPIDDTTDI